MITLRSSTTPILGSPHSSSSSSLHLVLPLTPTVHHTGQLKGLHTLDQIKIKINNVRSRIVPLVQHPSIAMAAAFLRETEEDDHDEERRWSVTNT